MKCLRSGYCCIRLDVIIVDDPDKGIDPDNLIHKPSGSPCKHLQGDSIGEYSCAIHDFSWYRETPCFAHDQIGNPDSPCRIGAHLIHG